MIEVEGLPEGFEINSVTINAGETISQCFNTIQATIHLKKIKPREIVLEEISKEEYHRLFNDERCSDIYNMRGSYWREVKKTDIPLINEDANVKMGVSQGDGGYYPTLELNVKELRNVRSLIKDFENLGWFINPERALLLQKITEFIKDK